MVAFQKNVPCIRPWMVVVMAALLLQMLGPRRMPWFVGKPGHPFGTRRDSQVAAAEILFTRTDFIPIIATSAKMLETPTSFLQCVINTLLASRLTRLATPTPREPQVRSR